MTGIRFSLQISHHVLFRRLPGWGGGGGGGKSSKNTCHLWCGERTIEGAERGENGPHCPPPAQDTRAAPAKDTTWRRSLLAGSWWNAGVRRGVWASVNTQFLTDSFCLKKSEFKNAKASKCDKNDGEKDVKVQRLQFPSFRWFPPSYPTSPHPTDGQTTAFGSFRWKFTAIFTFVFFAEANKWIWEIEKSRNFTNENGSICPAGGEGRRWPFTDLSFRAFLRTPQTFYG